MQTIDDGGPAYPGIGEIFIDGPQGRMPRSAWGMEGSKGMSLRDWFAGQALAGMMAQPDERPCPKDRLADLEKWRSEQYAGDAAQCYSYADAMLSARNKPATTL